MTSPSCLIDLKNILPRNSGPQVIAALRHDAVIWNALQNPDFRRAAISKLCSHPEKWTPARLALLALKVNQNPADVRATALSEIDPELRLQAIQAYEEQAQASPTEMDLETAGLLMLALLEHYRLTKSWEKIPHGDHWKTAFACLYGCLEHPSAFLLTLPAALMTHILLSNPLTPEEQAQGFTTILVSSSHQVRLTILRELASQKPVFAQNLARQLWKPPQNGNRTPTVSTHLLADLWPQFEQLHALTTELNHTLNQAEAQFGAGYGEQAQESLFTACQTAGGLQNILGAQAAQIAATLGKLEESQNLWQVARTPVKLSPENTAALGLAMIEKGAISQAQELADSHPQGLLADYLRAASPENRMESIFMAAREGDAAARGLIEDRACYLGIALANLVNVLNPEVILLGGMFAQGHDLIIPVAEAKMRAAAFAGLGDNVRLSPSNFGWRAGVLGASALALTSFFYHQSDGS